MASATLKRPTKQSEIYNDRVTINSKGDFTNFNYVTPKELEIYLTMFYTA